MTVVSLNHDCSQLGCGHRLYIVVKVGRRWVSLFQPSTLITIKIAKADYDRLATPVIVRSRKKMAARIRANQRQAKRLGLRNGGSMVRAAITALEQQQ